jgi:hypothetical protein
MISATSFAVPEILELTLLIVARYIPDQFHKQDKGDAPALLEAGASPVAANRISQDHGNPILLSAAI